MVRLTAMFVVCCAVIWSAFGGLLNNKVGARRYDTNVELGSLYYDTENASNATGCLFGLNSCSFTITGNLILIVSYGIVLAIAAKMISDGAELLLDLGLPASIIGGVVLPLLGAIPDSAMILFSGVTGSKEDADKQISVGMGTLAGSTIMLLTLPWLGSLILGRVDIVNGEGRDEQVSRFNIKSFINQGVTVCPDVTYSAIIMLITTLPYLIVQGADWHWGPSREVSKDGQSHYIRYCALVTFIIALIFLFGYLAIQVVFAVNSKRKEQARREEKIKRRVLKQFYLAGLHSNPFQPPAKPVQTADKEEAGEAQPLLGGATLRVAKAWRMHRSNKQADNGNGEEKKKEEEESDDPKWLIFIKSSFLLVVGVVMVTVFSDPMVGALASITDKTNGDFFYNGKRGQHIPIGAFYVSFVITPICSNASELVSSLIFASKKKKVNTSMTYSQLYGAATMNNTLCLAVFAALVYFRDLDWQFSAEVTVILLIEFAVGITAIVAGFAFKHTYRLILGLFIGALYFLSILIIALLETKAKWK